MDDISRRMRELIKDNLLEYRTNLIGIKIEEVPEIVFLVASSINQYNRINIPDNQVDYVIKSITNIVIDRYYNISDKTAIDKAIESSIKLVVLEVKAYNILCCLCS
jgi:hypothetical protein